jgi:hypothetical protein
MDTHDKSGQKVNSLSIEEVDCIVDTLCEKTFKRKGITLRYLYRDPIRGKWMTDLRPTKTKKGYPKYPQVDITRFNVGVEGKVLVHHLYFRYVYEELIDQTLHISHLDSDPRVVECVQESKDMNESRKYCHLFSWYKALDGEDRPRCPHWENPCSGP